MATLPDEPAATTVAAPPGRPPRPLHKGYADLSTGLYAREDDDLIVPTSMPLVLRRTYNSGDAHSRQFGLDWTHPGEWWLYGDGDPRIPWGDLILASGARIHFVRISSGETQQGAVLRNDSSPTEFNGALLRWTGPLWDMQLRDGSTASFLDCNSDKENCSLVERRDPAGHRIAYVRNAAGRLERMESEGQSISFDYDDHNRIVRAYDSQQHEVSYLYDDHGRLVRATSSDGTVRDYAYDDRGGLIGVREPGRILNNWYDASGRWIRQVLKDSEDDPDPYVATARYVIENGSIVESAFDEGDGVEVTRYSKGHYVVSNTLDADGAAPIVFTYDRDPVTNVTIGATMSCVGEAARITRTVPLAAATDDDLKEALARAYCVRRR